MDRDDARPPSGDEEMSDRPPPTPPASSGPGVGWNFAGCIVAPVGLILILAVVIGLSSLGVPITEDQFAGAAARLPLALAVVAVLVVLIRWYVRLCRRGSPRRAAVKRFSAVVLVAVVVFGAVTLAVPVGRTSLDVTDRNSLTFQVFWPQSTWDLAYLFDCGTAPTDVGISVGSMNMNLTSDAGLIVVPGLAAGPAFIVTHGASCHWHLMAGPDLNVSALAAALTASASNDATGPKIDADVKGDTEKELPFATDADPELLFAYDCGAQTFPDPANPAFDLLYTNHDPGNEVSGSLVRTFAPKAWGMLAIRSAPLYVGSEVGYSAPPGTESLDVATSCAWHISIGRGIAVQRLSIDQ